jgi:flagellin
MFIKTAGAMQNLQSLGQSNKALSRIQEKLASGKKINRASDDAAMLAVAKELEKQVRGFSQSEVNIGDAMSVLNIADGTGTEVNNMLQRQRELSLQASNGTLNQNDRNALNAEYQQLNQEIERISKSANFNGQGVADGSSPLSDGSGQVATSAGNSNFANVDFTQYSSNGDISSIAGAQSALETVDASIEGVNATRAEIGARNNALEHSQNNIANQKINTSAAQSLAEDLDYAAGISEQARAGLLNQSSNAALGHFNSIAKANMSALLSG